jgi:hypothetical protein
MLIHSEEIHRTRSWLNADCNSYKHVKQGDTHNVGTRGRS